MEDEWEEFLKLLKEISEGKGTGCFEPFGNNRDPKTWEEMITRIEDLPGDEPITWQPIDKNISSKEN